MKVVEWIFDVLLELLGQSFVDKTRNSKLANYAAVLFCVSIVVWFVIAFIVRKEAGAFVG